MSQDPIDTPATPEAGGPGSPIGTPLAQLARLTFGWILARGILAVLLGLILVIAPLAGGSIVAMAIVISIALWLVLDGVLLIRQSLRARRASGPGWGWQLAAGVLTLLAGVLALIFPLSIAVVGGLMVLWFLAIGLIVRGVLELVHRSLGGWSIALGVIDLLFGIGLTVMIASNPGGALVALAWVAGIYAIVFGISAIVLAVQVRRAAP